MKHTRSSRSRFAWVSLVVGALLIVALLVAEFDSPELGRVLLTESGSRVGARLEADAFRLNLLRGLELDGLLVKSRLPDGRLRIQADSLRFGHRLLPLLAGRLVVTKATLESPDIRFTRRSPRPADAAGRKGHRARATAGPARRLRQSPPGASRSAPTDQTDGTRSALRVETIALDNAHIVISASSAGEPILEVSGLDMELRDLLVGPDPANRLVGSTARGTLRAQDIALRETLGQRLRGRLELEGGRLRLLDLGLTLPAGEVVAETLEVDLAQDSLPFLIRMEGRSLDSGLLLGAGGESGMGKADLSFTGSGLAAGKAELDGAGRLTLRAGRLPAIELFTALDSLLGATDLVGAHYEEFAVPFRVRGERILMDPSHAQVGHARLSMSGWTDRQGALALSLVVSAPRDQVKIGELPDSLLDKLTDPQGIASLAFSVTGTRDRPRVVPDLPEMSKKERKELERALQRELRDRLRDLVERSRPVTSNPD